LIEAASIVPPPTRRRTVPGSDTAAPRARAVGAIRPRRAGPPTRMVGGQPLASTEANGVHRSQMASTVPNDPALDPAAHRATEHRTRGESLAALQAAIESDQAEFLAAQ